MESVRVVTSHVTRNVLDSLKVLERGHAVN